MRNLALIGILIAITSFANDQETLKLRAAPNPPYQLLVNGKLSGQSIDVLQCVLGKMDYAYEISLLPWARANEELKSGASDGIFTAAPAASLDKFAEMSAPFALEKWHWYFRHHDSAKIFSPQGKSIGVVRSGNPASWMKNYNLTTTIEVNTVQQLVRMLQSGRIDAFIEDELKVQDALKELRLEQNVFDSDFSHYMPLGIYFSREFLQKSPDFLEFFNGQLQYCAQGRVALNPLEQEKIETLTINELQPSIAALQGLVASLKEENERLATDKTRGSEYDQRWFADLKKGGGPFIQQVEAHPLSKQLKALQARTARLISEIYLTGSKGFNLAQSQATSDFDQSDEAEYEAVVTNKQSLFISPIEYDESAKAFQVKVAWPLIEQQQTIGMIVIGLNAEVALRQMELYYDLLKNKEK